MSDEQKFTAIIYYHGIGQQSRYEELSRVLESFDDYAYVQEDNRLDGLQVGVEASRTDMTDKNVGYVSFMRDGKAYRFYEVYWAPLTASGTSGWDVFKWFMSHIITPIRILNSSWHTRRRLRISYLYSLWDKRHPDSSQFIPLMKLINLYNAFCDHALRGSQVKGKFDEFERYVGQESDKEDSAELLQLAQDWRNTMRRKEFWNFFVFLSIGYIVAIVPVITIARTLFLFYSDLALDLSLNFWDLARVLISSLFVADAWRDVFQNEPLVLVFYLLLLFLLPVPSIIAKFLKDYGGDVQLWATYQENNEKYLKRKAILELSLETTTHVLNHEGCERVLLMAHSLGTTIAFDTLLSIGRHNRAVKAELDETTSTPRKLKPGVQTLMPQGAGGGAIPLASNLSKSGDEIQTDNIEYFVTMGSPVDKIYYFFESKQGLYRPYELIVDEIRGDIGEAPFVLDSDIPNFRWINFWEQEDYVGGALFTPNPRVYKRREQSVNNVLIKSYEFPSPGRSHVGYFRHNQVIGVLYRLIFRRDDPQSSRELQKLLDTKPKLQTQRLRDGMLIATWSLLFAIVFDILGWNLLQMIFTVIFFGLLTVGTIVTIMSFARGALHPFKRWSDTK